MNSVTKRPVLAALALSLAFISCSQQEESDTAVPRSAKASPAGGKRAGAKGVQTAGVNPLAAGGETRPGQPAGEALPVRPRALLQSLPRESLLVLRFPHVEGLREAWRRTALSSLYSDLLEDPEFISKLSPGAPMPLEAYEAAVERMVQEVPEIGPLMKLLPELRGEVVVALTGFVPPTAPGAPPFTATMLVDAGSQVEELKKALDPVIEALGRSGAPGFARKDEEWGFEAGAGGALVDVSCRDGILCAFFGPRKIVQGLRLEQGLLPDEQSFRASTLARATPDLSASGSVVAEGYLNLAPLWSIAKMAAPAAVNSLRAGGLLRLEGASFSVALGEKGLSEAVTWCSPGCGDLLSRALTARPLNHALARWVPADAASAGLCALDVDSLFSDVMIMLPEEARRGVQRGLDDLRRFQGFDLRTDLIENVGPTLAVVSRGDLASWVRRESMEMCVVLEVSDQEKAERLLSAWLGSPGMEAHVRNAEVEGLRVRTISGKASVAPPDVSVSWCVADGCVLVSSDEALLASCLRSGKGSETIAHVGLREALAKAGEKAWSVSVTAAPDGLPPTVAIGRATDSGLVIESRDGSGGVAMGGFAGVGVVAAVVIPQLLVARAPAVVETGR